MNNELSQEANSGGPLPLPLSPPREISTIHQTPLGTTESPQAKVEVASSNSSGWGEQSYIRPLVVGWGIPHQATRIALLPQIYSYTSTIIFFDHQISKEWWSRLIATLNDTRGIPNEDHHELCLPLCFRRHLGDSQQSLLCLATLKAYLPPSRYEFHNRQGLHLCLSVNLNSLIRWFTCLVAYFIVS